MSIVRTGTIEINFFVSLRAGLPRQPSQEGRRPPSSWGRDVTNTTAGAPPLIWRLHAARGSSPKFPKKRYRRDKIGRTEILRVVAI